MPGKNWRAVLQNLNLPSYWCITNCFVPQESWFQLKTWILRPLRTRNGGIAADFWERKLWVLQQGWHTVWGNVASAFLIANMRRFRLRMWEMRRRKRQSINFARHCLSMICFRIATMITTLCWGISIVVYYRINPIPFYDSMLPFACRWMWGSSTEYVHNYSLQIDYVETITMIDWVI